LKLARRTFLSAGAAFALVPSRAGEGSRLAIRGSLQQGGLVIGHVAAGATVTVDDTAALLSPEGIFAFGLAYDRIKPVHVVAKFADGTSETSDVAPLVRQYEVQTINGLPEKFVTPSAEDQARIERENTLIVEARKRATDGAGFAEPFDWPFPGIVTGVYGSQRVLNGKPMAPHLGIDIAAPEGTPIHAAADSVVSISDDYFLDGGFTLLDHGHGVSTCYLHQSKRLVKEGDKLAKGDVIGLVGHTGRATGPHTHWGLNWFQLKLDPSLAAATGAPPKA